MTNAEHILAIDPGGTTGLVWCSMDEAFGVGYSIRERQNWTHRFVDRIEWGSIDGTIAQQSWKLAVGIQRIKARIVVWESSDHFLLAPRGGRAMRKHSLIPIKMAGALETIVMGLNKQGHHIVGVEQTASQAKSVVKDELLMAVGIGKGMNRHEKDATRHLILFLRRVLNGTQFAEFIVNGLGEHI